MDMQNNQEQPKRMGRPPIAGKPTVPLTTMVTPEQDAKIRRVAAHRQTSVSAVMRLLVERLADAPS